ncbi:MAG TPA: type I DNA topoisomerase, partial [Thermodesulfobacteriota bacterium]|nr:type I DNA topoisomerase [Thermodesulfobacteriota bacterium]
MSKGLIVVESPTKVKTLQKFLGGDYVIKASVGHIKDLPESELGVDLKKDFLPEYVVIPGKSKIIRELKKASKGVKNIYLGPDPDREGEAIAWHIAEEIGNGNKNIYRVLFNEITKRAVLEALQKPGTLQQSKYEAQQARRILDRLVGYQISPILWDKVRRGLSAGRVQSVAVRIICEREREIQNFVSQESWSLTATLKKNESPLTFSAKLTKWKGKKVTMANESEALAIKKDLETVPYSVSKITQQEKKRHPFPPFITSRLQQEAYRKLSFSAQKTMRVAQKLYEGIDLGDLGMVGLITYMRTDSPRVSMEAVQQVRSWIKNRFGEPFLPPKPNVYKSRKGAQEAHEAIRPTSFDFDPEKVKDYLDREEWALYKLIWDRFVASQMASAVFLQTSVEIKADDGIFTAVGTVPTFLGFMSLYVEGEDNSVSNGKQEEGEEERRLPALSEGEILKLMGLDPKQHFTQPPPRFSEATLIKELEEKGIGRPSTYATILSTIKGKEYVKLEKGRFMPTELGLMVNDLLVVNFPDILDIEFTAQMEENLDRVEEGEKGWIETLKEFYAPFQKDLEMAKASMREIKIEKIPTEVLCERCGSKMVKRWGKRGYFLACSTYPKCRYTREVEGNGEKNVETTDARCEKCGSPMVIKSGKFGRFLACSNYPTCKFTRAIDTGVHCPQEGCDG